MNQAAFAPLISIPLCTYNGERFLAMQLDSLLAQTHPNIEVLAFDDVSTDGTVTILAEYSRKDPRIKVHVNQTNLGFKKNFAQALLHCCGDFIAPCDQDDIWMPAKLSTLISALGQHALAYCDSQFIDAAGVPFSGRVSDIKIMLDTDDPSAFVLDNCVSGHAMLFRRALLSSALPIPDGLFHDWWIVAVAASAGGVTYCPAPLVHYRQHGGNVTDLIQARTVRRAQRAPGSRLQYLREVGQRLEAFSQLPGKQQVLLLQLSYLWRLRESQWVSWHLCWLMLRHGARLRRIQKLSRWQGFRESLQMLPGIKLKRLISPRAYAVTECHDAQSC